MKRIDNLIFVLVICMLTFGKVFGMERVPETAPLGHSRTIDFSGNRFTFAMPEDFSREMPAEDLVESASLPALAASPDRSSVLLRRWWDIRKSGFFGRELGTVMMLIAVRQVSENTSQLIHSEPYDIRRRLDFILAIDENIRTAYRNLEEGQEHDYGVYGFPSVVFMLGNDLRSEYRDETLNGQRWTRYGLAGPEAELINVYALPLTDDFYLEVIFNFAPNRNVVPMEFTRIADNKMAIVRKTFYVEYAPGNEVRELVEEKWLQSTTDDLMKANRELLLPEG